ncbi:MULTISPECIES: hypothetical protein [Flavobacterium]|uniref:Uncharacterized protein n=1 Tax=Flavobacterium hankyongi TaxID=1176532 RepID=A0ABP8ZJM4_9FLAO|nr:hypothetical protein [Flavobacterium sp. N1846]
MIDFKFKKCTGTIILMLFLAIDCFAFIDLVSNDKNKITNMSLEMTSNNYSGKNKVYYLQVYSNNCRWEIFTNEILASYNEDSRVVNTTFGINQNILTSGKQRIYFRVYPNKNEKTINNYAVFKVTLSYNEIGNENESEIVKSYIMPDQENKISLIENELIFDVDVPYVIDKLVNAQKLNEINKIGDKIVSKLNEFKSIIEKGDSKKYLDIYEGFLKRRHITYFSTKEEIELDLKNESLESFMSEIYDLEILPIQKDAKIVYFGNGKVACLLQNDMKSGEKKYGLIYKAKYKDDNSICFGTINFLLYMPNNSNELLLY